jgi:hypothetical protein
MKNGYIFATIHAAGNAINYEHFLRCGKHFHAKFMSPYAIALASQLWGCSKFMIEVFDSEGINDLRN